MILLRLRERRLTPRWRAPVWHWGKLLTGWAPLLRAWRGRWEPPREDAQSQPHCRQNGRPNRGGEGHAPAQSTHRPVCLYFHDFAGRGYAEEIQEELQVPRQIIANEPSQFSKFHCSFRRGHYT